MGAVDEEISGELVIPSEFDGKPVTAIYDEAFNGAAITSVSIPDCVTAIGSGAFAACEQLSEINGGTNVAYIGTNYSSPFNFDDSPWFENAKANGEELILGKVLVNVGGIVGKLTVPDGIVSVFPAATGSAIGSSNYKDGDELLHIYISSVELPDGFEFIDRDVFEITGYCKPADIGIFIPRSVTYIDLGGFRTHSVEPFNIWYEGSEEEWNSVIKTGKNSDDYVISFNNEKIPDSASNNRYKPYDHNIPYNDVHSIKSDENFKYAVFSDYVMLVGSVDNEISGELVIPSEFEGKPVTAIYDNAFLHTKITSVTIPYSVTTIGASAFSCSDITEVKGGKNVSRVLSSEHFNAGVLHATLWIKEIIENNEAAVLGNTMLHVGSCEKGGDYVFPEGITAIDQCAFYNYSFSPSYPSLAPASVTFPEGLKEIPVALLPDSVKDVYIPVSVEAIYRNAFKFSDKEDVGTKDIWYAGTEAQWNAIYNELKIPDGVTVHFGAEGIPAKKETKTTPGDANNDGKVNVADAVAVLQFIANKEMYPLDANGTANADCDGITGITGSDVIYIQKIDAGVI